MPSSSGGRHRPTETLADRSWFHCKVSRHPAILHAISGISQFCPASEKPNGLTDARPLRGPDMTPDDAHTVVRPSIGLGEEQLSDNRLTRARPPKVTILVCALNEEATIAEVLSRIPSWVEEVLLVDGGSNDRTIQMPKSSHDKVRDLSQP